MKERIIRSIPKALEVTRAIDPTEVKFIIVPVELNKIENNFYAKVKPSKVSNLEFWDLEFGDSDDFPEYTGLDDPNWEDGMMVGIRHELYKNYHRYKLLEWRFFDDENLIFSIREEDGHANLLNRYKIKIHKGVERLLGKEKMKPFKDIWDTL